MHTPEVPDGVGRLLRRPESDRRIPGVPHHTGRMASVQSPEVQRRRLRPTVTEQRRNGNTHKRLSRQLLRRLSGHLPTHQIGVSLNHITS